MRTSDFWIEENPADLWGPFRRLDTALLERIMHGHIPEHPDVEVGVALARFTHEQFEGNGTRGADINQVQSGVLMRALKVVLARLGITSFAPPFRDFDTFYKHWKSVGASGSGGWQARRNILDEHFEPLHELLGEREAGSITSTLALAISPRRVTGWPRVDEEVSELRRHFEAASTQQDYK